MVSAAACPLIATTTSFRTAGEISSPFSRDAQRSAPLRVAAKRGTYLASGPKRGRCCDQGAGGCRDHLAAAFRRGGAWPAMPPQGRWSLARDVLLVPWLRQHVPRDQ